MSFNPRSNSDGISNSAYNATMSSGPVSPRRPSIEFQHFHPAPPQRPASAASRRSRSVSVHSLAQQAQHHPNNTPEDPGFPGAAFHTRDGIPLFTRQQVQSEVDRQSWEYRRDADRLGGEYQKLKDKITSLEAELEKGADAVNAKGEAEKRNRDAQDTLAAATAREVTLPAQLEQANAQLKAKMEQLQTKGHLYDPQINCLQAELQAVVGDGADIFDQQWAKKEAGYKEEVERLQQQLTGMRAYYNGQAAREAQQMPKVVAEVAPLRAQVAQLKREIAAAKHQANNMRLTFDQQLLEKDTEIGRLEDYEKAYRRDKKSHAEQLITKDEEIAALSAGNAQLRSASSQQLSQQLFAKDNEITILKEATEQLEEAKTQAGVNHSNALTSQEAIRADEQHRSQVNITILQKDLKTVQADLKTGEHELKVQDDAFRELKHKHAERMNQVYKELGVTKEQVQQLQQSDSDKSKTIKQLQTQLKAVGKELKVKTEQVKKLKGKNLQSPEDQGLTEELAAMEAILRQSQEHLGKMTNIKKGETAEVVKLKGELAEALKTISELKAEIDEMRADTKTLQSELKQAVKAEQRAVEAKNEAIEAQKEAVELQKEVAENKVKSLEMKLKRARDGLVEERKTKRVKMEVKSEETDPKD